jgi:hypothetical protein
VCVCVDAFPWTLLYVWVLITLYIHFNCPSHPTSPPKTPAGYWELSPMDSVPHAVARRRAALSPVKFDKRRASLREADGTLESTLEAEE